MSTQGQDRSRFAHQIANRHLEYLTPNDWSLLIERASRITFNKNDILIRQGTPASALYLIVAGSVDVAISGHRAWNTITLFLLQVTFVCLAACEDDFCGYEQECARIHRGRFSARR